MADDFATTRKSRTTDHGAGVSNNEQSSQYVIETSGEKDQLMGAAVSESRMTNYGAVVRNNERIFQDAIRQSGEEDQLNDTQEMSGTGHGGPIMARVIYKSQGSLNKLTRHVPFINQSITSFIGVTKTDQ
ncbi:hypothetical protein SK128_002992 [Halocaridina rubra]|uniref:Uncharacterized protein n=1 Tax=Halocaridina rubra TaxID=373956 RepID=A0AAN8XLZ7_HALRR